MKNVLRTLTIIIAIEIIILAIILKTTSAKATTINETTTVSTTTVESTETIDTPEIITLEEMYDSVFKWQKYSGDFGVEQLYFLKDQCNKYNIPMEIMLSIICTESGFRSDAKAKTSSASGYCQIIRGTAEWIYEDKLHYGEYDVTNHREIMCTNWKLNIEISCRLVSCLYQNNGQSWENAIKKYYGSTNETDNIKYLNKVNNNMNDLFNIVVSDLT
jgi:hypothetical protein